MLNMNLRLIVGALAASLLVAGCGGTIAPGGTVAPSSNGVAPAAPTATAAPAPLTGPVGTPFTDTDAMNNVMKVTLTGVSDPAQPGPYTPVTNGDRLVAAKFSITGVSGTFSSDVFIDASLVGSDEQTYQATPLPVNGCTSFKSGTYSVTPGVTSVGCAAFEVPTAVHVAKIQWGGFLNSGIATWTVGG